MTSSIILAYFADVLVGMLMIYREYEDEPRSFHYLEREENYKLTDRPYDIIEIALLFVSFINGTV